MKYIVLVGDGMGDYPVADLGGKTPLQAAQTPHMDWIADHGEIGRAKTIPEGCETGSDTANLSLLGYNPKETQTRRAPLEAASLGIALGPADVAFRCNLVTLSGRDDDLTMEDYSAGHISSEEARELIEAIDASLGNETVGFFSGVSYRHVMVWHGGVQDVETTPPHDITGQAVRPYLDKMAPQEMLLELMKRASSLLSDHPVNRNRMDKGQRPATHIWLWGQGHAPDLEAFERKTGLKGAIISAVDLLRGIGVYTGLQVIRVPGATGYFDTNYEGKARHALSALEQVDLVYVHVEAPDEASHAGLLEEKIRAIEAFDAKVVGTVLEGMKPFGQYRIMVTTDHFTPLSVRTHTTEPVPFAMCGTGIAEPPSGPGGFGEAAAEARGLLLPDGYRLMDRFLRAGQ
jgi:2,3-bisphosphoglycerate-independent phosphoglycerate mutase